jgi:asparagine synthetase B (glutamine-hydrolysing)
LHAIHWTLKDPQLAQYDESMRCKPVAEKWGIPYQEIDVQLYGQLYDYPGKAPHRDEPFRSQLYGWYDASLAAMVGPHSPRVWLTGHIGDMMVGGFNPYYYLNLLKTGRLNALSQEISSHRALYNFSFRQLLGFVLPPLLLQPALQQYRKWARNKQLRVPDFISPHLARRTGLSEWMYEQTYDWKKQTRSWVDPAKRMRFHWVNYPQDLRLRTWYDRLAAAWGLEITTPWDDIRLKEFILCIPEEQICQGVNHKLILRRAMRDLLPEVTRERRGLRVGTPLYITEPLRSREAELKINALLANSRSAEAGLIDLDAFRCAIQEYRSGKKPYSLRLWSVLSLEVWLRAHDFQD